MKNYRLKQQVESHILDVTIIQSYVNRIEACEGILARIDEGATIEDMRHLLQCHIDSMVAVVNRNYNSKIEKI